MYNKVPASSAQTAYRLFPPIGENALTPLRLLSPPDPLRWAPVGAPERRVGVVLPLRPLPGLRPYPGKCPSRISPIPRLVRWLIVQVSAAP